jgi:hypothetical protein
MMRALAPLLLAVIALGASAHKASDAYLTLGRDGAAVTGRWDIALRDLDAAIGLDANADGEITWGELRSKHPRIERYALSRLSLMSGGASCTLRVTGHQVDAHTDGAYAVLALAGECPGTAPALEVRYSALFDVDPQHRGLVNFVERSGSRSLVLSADTPHAVLGGDAGHPARQFLSYAREGAWHIGIGFDHLLFLVSLLLPAVLVRRAGDWHAAPTFGSAFWDVFGIVTAFTLAHSITLTLAVLQVVALPSRLVEAAIAASVVVAAINNVVPAIHRGRWIVAFAFGLVHGFGFAGVLVDLGLPRGSLALSLAGFNVGVEVGQLAIVAVVLPVAFALRRTVTYRRVVLLGGSLAIAALATVWLVERAFDWPLVARLGIAAAW